MYVCACLYFFFSSYSCCIPHYSCAESFSTMILIASHTDTHKHTYTRSFTIQTQTHTVYKANTRRHINAGANSQPAVSPVIHSHAANDCVNVGKNRNAHPQTHINLASDRINDTANVPLIVLSGKKYSYCVCLSVLTI